MCNVCYDYATKIYFAFLLMEFFFLEDRKQEKIEKKRFC